MDRSLKNLLGEGRPLIGTLLSLPSPEISEISVEAGFDWLFIDMEHGLIGPADAQRMIQAAAGRAACVVRVPANEPAWISKALDIGASGLIFPHINGAEEARAAVWAAKYPPEGARSIGIARAQGYGARVAESLEKANLEVGLVAQAEHVDAARNIDDILAVRGLDAVFIGPYDLSGSLGKPGRTSDPEVLAAIARIRENCASAGIPSGIFVRDAEGVRKAVAEGFTLICAGTDALLLGAAARELLAEAKAAPR